MADVSFQHPEYKASEYRWSVVADVCDGQETVKAAGEKYLPRLNSEDTSKEARDRYNRYRQRAAFHNITGRTKDVLVGIAFAKPPAIEAPGAVEPFIDDIDGAGVSIDQQAHKALEEVLKVGRFGLLVDYPQTSAPSSRADMASGLMRPVTIGIDASQVINWRTERVGAQTKLVLLVIAESVIEITDDGFGQAAVQQNRVLRLNEGKYTQELWRKDGNGAWYVYMPEFAIVDGSGAAWDEIPFAFVGSVNNDSRVDPSPLYDMAELNLAHYRNSADYEDGVFYAGQAQPWMAGLSEEWRDWMQEQGLYVGSRAPILLPEGGQYGIAQAQPNTQAKEAMDQKESQMVALGARLIQPGSAVKTATEAQGELESNHSVLSLAVANVSDAYTKCLNWMLRFMGVSGEASFAINSDFSRRDLDATIMTALATVWGTGQLPESDLWRAMRRTNLIDPQKTDEEIKEEIDSQMSGIDLDGDIAATG